MSKWIESHQSIASHPKLFKLASMSGLSPDVCIAKLHRLWWWALQYAEDGYLDMYSPEEVCYGIGIEDNELAKKFFNALVESRWIDKELRIHDWLEYAGRYLKSKYHTANPSKYQAILDKWIGKPIGTPKGQAKKRTAKPKGDQPNLTLPNLTKHTYGEFQNVLLTDDEVEKLKAVLNGTFDHWVKTLDEGIEQKGYKYRSHYLTILKWKEKEEKTGKRYL